MSPDQNAIEHLWKELKHKIWRRHPSPLRQLEQFDHEEWAKYPSTAAEVSVRVTEIAWLQRLPPKVVQQIIKLRLPSTPILNSQAKDKILLGVLIKRHKSWTLNPRLLEVFLVLEKQWHCTENPNHVNSHWQTCYILQNVTMTLIEFTPPLQVCCFHTNAVPCLVVFLWATVNTKLPWQLMQHREVLCTPVCQSK